MNRGLRAMKKNQRYSVASGQTNELILGLGASKCWCATHRLLQIVEQLLQSYQQTTPVIISSADEISIRQLVEIISGLMNFKGKIEWLTHLSNGQHRKPSDISRLKSILPHIRFTGIYDGLKRTVEWFESNYPQLRK